MWISIVIGVALCVAVDAINSSALKQFESTTSALSAQSDFYIQHRSHQSALTQTTLEILSQWAEIEQLQPMIQRRWPLLNADLPENFIQITAFDFNLDERFQVLGSGSDFLKLLAMASPFGVPVLAVNETALEHHWDLGTKVGLRTAGGEKSVILVGLIPANLMLTQGLLMDLRQAQNLFSLTDEFDRIDIKLRDPEDLKSVQQKIARQFPQLVSSDARLDRQRIKGMTRAYRINLGMLSLVALITAGFLVFSLLSLSFRRRREQLHLLRLLGLSRSHLLLLLTLESFCLGVLGSVFGMVLGLGLAQAGMMLFGGDLGAGYFNGADLNIELQRSKLLSYFLLGLGVTMVSSGVPVWMAFSDSKQPLIRAGAAEDVIWLAPGRSFVLALGLLGLAFYLSHQAAVAAIPVAGYLAIVACLLSGYFILPGLIQQGLRWIRLTHASAAVYVAISQVRGAPGRAANASGAVLVSFALLVAMTIMVSSFRHTVVDWLEQVLAADYYAWTNGIQRDLYFSSIDLQAVANSPLIKTVSPILDIDYQYSAQALKHPVKLSARDFSQTEIRELFIDSKKTRKNFNPQTDLIVSETFSGIYDLKIGDPITLNLGQQASRFRVAAIWRDYGYQHGRILIDWSQYSALTHSDRFNGMALHLENYQSQKIMTDELNKLIGERSHLELVSSAQIKNLSLVIFDRTFAVTYLLVLIAALVGTFAIVNTLAMQAKDRMSEFAMLKHMGMDTGSMIRCLAYESSLLMAAGILGGLGVGLAISMILIHVVNTQSFHWTIDTYVPYLSIIMYVCLFIAVGFFAGAFFGWRLCQLDAVEAVRSE